MQRLNILINLNCKKILNEITNSIPHSSTVLFPRHLSLAQCSPDLGSCADLNCALGCPFLPQHKNEFFVLPMPCLGTQRHGFALLQPKAMAAAVPSDFSMPQQQSPCWSVLQGPREKRRQRVCGASWCLSQGYWAALQEGGGQRALLESRSAVHTP